MIKMPHGTNIDTHRLNGTQPNQNFEKYLVKIMNPNPFSKNPQF